MGVGRLAPHRIRARYARVLKEIPLPVRSFAGIDPSALTIVGEVEIAYRQIEFGKLPHLPRLWISAPDQTPPIMGFLTGLDSGSPELHITGRDHLDWVRASGRSGRIKRAALVAWQASQKECRG